jgi:hypothetical protein
MRNARLSRSTRSTAVVFAIAAAGSGIGFWHSSEASGSTASPGPPAGTLKAAPAPGPLGPEDVAIPRARALAPPGRPAVGSRVDGIPCGSIEQLAFHVHAHLTIFVSGKPRQVPAGIGIGPPRNIQPTTRGGFVVGGACFSWLHTHAADGVIHIESPVQRKFTVGNLFDVWRQPLGPRRLGSVTGTVTAFLDGRRYRGNPRAIPLTAQAQIQLEIGRPVVAPVIVRFPQGL